MALFRVENSRGCAVSPGFPDSGRAIDFFVKRKIERLLPSRNEKRVKWLEMKSTGYTLVRFEG